MIMWNGKKMFSHILEVNPIPIDYIRIFIWHIRNLLNTFYCIWCIISYYILLGLIWHSEIISLEYNNMKMIHKFYNYLYFFYVIKYSEISKLKLFKILFQEEKKSEFFLGPTVDEILTSVGGNTNSNDVYFIFYILMICC